VPDDPWIRNLFDPGTGIRDEKSSDPGIGINIPISNTGIN